MNFTLQDGRVVHLIGDPHMGKKFENGVPLDRRGDREKRQMLRLQINLSKECDFNVMVGDLFDHPHVGYSVVLDVANAYIDQARAYPETTFIAMAGNHDLPRNLGVVGAFDVFEKLVSREPNIEVLRQPLSLEGALVFFPWEWNRSAIDQLDGLDKHPKRSEFEAVIGHWDLQSYGGDDSHMAPTKALKEALSPNITIYSGHYHVPGTYGDVHCTGSMEPYSHAEDPDGEIYITVTLDELEGMDVTNKCVRVLLAEGEEMPVGLDCLALTAKRIQPEGLEQEVSGAMAAFDWASILEDCLKDTPSEVRQFISERLNA